MNTFKKKKKSKKSCKTVKSDFKDKKLNSKKSKNNLPPKNTRNDPLRWKNQSLM